MKKLLIIFLIFPAFLFSQSSKKYPSLLWKVSGKGLKKPSYLYGTMHVSNRVAYHLSEQFFDALKSVEVVGLETNPGEWLENMDKTGELGQINQFSNPYSYNQNFYKSTFSIGSPDKRMLQGILGYDPDIINGLLYRHNRSKENFEENTYIDLFIFQSASKLNKQVISLEDFVQSEIKARLSALPDEETDEGSAYRDYFVAAQKIEDAYRDGNLDMLDSLSKLTSTKNIQKYLIIDRNVFFANTIDSVLKTKSLFSGVGAAHLPGEMGVIELLRKKGYTVEPLISKNTKKSDLVRDQLDAKSKAVSFTKQFVPDSSFSVSLPGKITQIVNLENVKYYINADMVNGSFYTIVRLKYFGPLFNVTPTQMMEKVDSMLFEYIPGKTTLKKEITSNNGLKGIEIISKTRRGDEQHYQIYFSELEMIMFKLGGKQQYATSSEAKQFFNSIQFQSKNDNIVEFSPKTKGFSVKVPASFSYVKNEGSSLKGLVEDLYAYQKNTKQFYGLKHAVYNDFDYLEEDTFELNQFARHIVTGFNYKEKVSKTITEDLGLPCLKLSSQNNHGYFYGKLYIKGVHYYLVYFISEKESDFKNEYFTSFKLSDFMLSHPVKEVTDHDYHFKAIDEVTDNSFSRFNESYVREYEKTKSDKAKLSDSKSFDFNYKTSTKSYFSPSSNEYVNITYEKYNDYDYKTAKDFEDYLIKNIREANSLVPTHVKIENKDGVYSFKTIIKDTATRRAIDLRTYIKGGMRYEISAPFDTVIGLRNWTKGFMDSFTLEDTVIGKNIFENKFAKLLNDLCSSDTTIRKEANLSLQGSVNLQKVYAPDYINFISDKKIDLVNEDSKAQLFVNGGTLGSEKIIAPYKNLYKQYTDSFYLQLCLLKGLAYVKTQNSFTAFYNLVMGETPLVGNESTVNDVFAALTDSLELCKGFFPGMLTLTRYEEYKAPVYSLLASMVNKKIIGEAAYHIQKDNILADANLALKRFNPNKAAATPEYGGEYDYMDKSMKDVAENIQNSLDGLSNNNLYKGSNYLKSIEALNRPELVNYGFIISPLYKTDEKAKLFFTKLAKIKNQNITMPVFINLLKQNIIINDTLMEYYSKNRITRAYFYSELEKEKLSDKFSKKFMNQLSLVESVIYSQKQLAGIYNNEKDKKQKDSLYLVKEVPAGNKYQTGKIFIYSSQKVRSEDESWAIAFVPNSKHSINSSIDVISVNFAVDSKKSEEENINDVLHEFYKTFRKRAGVANSDLYFPGYN